MKTYSVIIHEAIGCGAGYWAEVEQLPGCIAFSDNLGRLSEDVEQAIEAHVKKLKQAGKPVPEGEEDAIQQSRQWLVAAPV